MSHRLYGMAIKIMYLVYKVTSRVVRGDIVQDQNGMTRSPAGAWHGLIQWIDTTNIVCVIDGPSSSSIVDNTISEECRLRRPFDLQFYF